MDAGTPTVAIVAKSWDFHVTDVLRTTLDENLAMVADSVAFLKAHGKEVVVDAEHFFDGLRANRDYALAVLEAAAEAGADWVVLCDTNGGSQPDELAAAVADVVERVLTAVGVHVHNDGELAVANTLAAVAAGARQVQGTINGYGERVGNANLCSVIPNLVLKLGRTCTAARAPRRARRRSRRPSTRSRTCRRTRGCRSSATPPSRTRAGSTSRRSRSTRAPTSTSTRRASATSGAS